MNIVSNNNISEPPRTDGLQIIGCIGYICQNCLITVPMKVYCSKSRGIFVSAHECDPQRLQDVLFMQEANRHNILYQLHAELPQLMRKVVNEWTKNQNYTFASEVQKQQIPQDNYTELNITNENDWAARAIKDNLTILNDDELLDFLIKSNNITFSIFKVNLKYKQEEFSSRYYLIYLTDRLDRTPSSFI